MDECVWRARHSGLDWQYPCLFLRLVETTKISQEGGYDVQCRFLLFTVTPALIASRFSSELCPSSPSSSSSFSLSSASVVFSVSPFFLYHHQPRESGIRPGINSSGGTIPCTFTVFEKEKAGNVWRAEEVLVVKVKRDRRVRELLSRRKWSQPVHTIST